mmetsp:Transcript_32129/g.93878  ORF Transcript_32129/g.93878 Transcript_32129/m.93878 type:complete len:126 (-) Transcript_32129:72-449(-)|eukprot:CAMPEP_0170271778 /NCGR_PEP_ID=MMETSP0116_2-20130129/35839_1 /TAXON_ID=400756 /ORGANISM="Durinskia baltica, Strain CSIRO CS-38" /LENGTH=125 /DNA_ID=CAMNT_0010522981 /DNA_START=59 /DNA_END=436 /DNA_ORIENTATION=-
MSQCLVNGCCLEDGDGFLSYVGNNQGEWIAETTYKYVGKGKGEFNVNQGGEKPKPGMNWCHMVGLLAFFVVVAFVALLLWPTGDAKKPTFDCESEADNFLVAWSAEKMAWCCRKIGKGCSNLRPQ